MATLTDSFEPTRLILLRKRIGLSDTQLGLRVGVSGSTISEWESGESRPQLGHMLALAEALGVPVSALLKGAG